MMVFAGDGWVGDPTLLVFLLPLMAGVLGGLPIFILRRVGLGWRHIIGVIFVAFLAASYYFTRPASLTHLQVTPDNVTVVQGIPIQFYAATKRGGVSNGYEPGIEWSCSHANAKVSAGGEVVGLSPGTTVVRARLDGLTAETTVSIVAGPIVSLAISPRPITYEDAPVWLSATAKCQNGTQIDVTKVCAWECTPERGMFVDSQPSLRTWNGPTGSCNVTANYGGASTVAPVLFLRAQRPK